MSTTTRLTLDQYDRLIAEGAFDAPGANHVELIRGEIRPMSPIGPPHETLVDLLNEWSFRSLPPGTAWVRVQNSIGLPELESAPEPDLAWVRRLDYRRRRPQAQDVLLVIEVADSSASYDRGPKAELYASAGIEDYWVVCVPDRCVEVRRQPQGGKYLSLETLHPSQVAHPSAFPDLAPSIESLFPDLLTPPLP